MIVASARRRFFGADGESRLGALALLAGLIALVPWAIEARADVIVLRGGGQVTGKVLPDPQNKDRVHVWLLQGRKPLSVQQSANRRGDPQGQPAR